MRRLLLVLGLLIALGAAAFWALTSPATVSPDALRPHTPNLENGKNMFYAGGCASCHATPMTTTRRGSAAGWR